MKLSIVIPVHNAHDVTWDSLDRLNRYSVTSPVVIIIDNASNPSFADWLVQNDHALDELQNIRVVIKELKENVGVWPTFGIGYDEAMDFTYDVSDASEHIIAYFHNDLWIEDAGWDDRVINGFVDDKQLGMVGFVGSNEWGANGGRGGGTMSNFQGIGRGSAAEVHGKRVTDLRPALQVDGCAMIMRRSTMDEVGFFEWPPHHFYDRIYSLRIIKAGWHVGVFGIACDHISGQTANTQSGWQDTAKAWCNAHGISEMTAHNWDYTVYNVAEQRFLTELHEYLAGRQLIRCLYDYSIV